MNTLTATDSAVEDPVFPEYETNLRRRLDYLGYAPCPVRAELRRRLHAAFLLSGDYPDWYMPAGCHEENVYDELWLDGARDDQPDLVSDLGFGDFLRPEFIKKHPGLYAPLAPALPSRPEFIEAGFVDPEGVNHVYSTFPYVILVDLEKLGSRRAPRGWADLLDGAWRNDVVINGEAGDLHEVLLFNFFRDFGEAGLTALAANISAFMHPAEMAKTAGSGRPDGAAVYVIPWFFARSNPHRERTALVWPVEGAYATPLYVFARPDRPPSVNVALDYLTGAEWAGHLARAGFPPARPDAPPIPGKLRWPGWDFVRSHDIQSMRAPLNAAFLRGRP